MVTYETDLNDFEAKLAHGELRVIMYVNLHGFSRHTEAGDYTDGIFAIHQLGRAVSQGLASVYGPSELGRVTTVYSAHRVMLSFPQEDSARVVTCATAIFREIEEVNRARAGLTPPATSLRCKAGIAAGKVIMNLHAHAHAAQGPVGEAVDKAWQLADIARQWQILVEQAYDDLVRDQDLSTIDGDRGILEPRPGLDKRVKGYRDLVRVKAFVWNGSQSSSAIRNSSVLVRELENLEGTLAEFLNQEHYILPMTRKDLEDGATTAAKDRIDSLASNRRTKKTLRWIGALASVRTAFQESTEAKYEPQVRRYFDALDHAYDQVKASLSATTATMSMAEYDPAVWRSSINQSVEQVFGMFEAARALQVAVNTLPRESE